MKKYFYHLKTITRHKWYVFKACKQSGILWQGIAHDLSKYHPIEFISSAKYFQGNRSPLAAEKEEKGYSQAWLNHKGRNKHHWEYWTDFQNGQLIYIKMPYDYVIELVCDLIGAGKVYNKEKWTKKEPLQYWNKNKHRIQMHIETKLFIEMVLQDIEQYHWEFIAYLLKKKFYKY